MAVGRNPRERRVQLASAAQDVVVLPAADMRADRQRELLVALVDPVVALFVAEVMRLVIGVAAAQDGQASGRRTSQPYFRR